MPGYFVFEVREFQVAMGIDQSGTKNTIKISDLITGFFGGYDIHHHPILVEDEHSIFREVFKPIEKTTGCEFAVQQNEC